MHKTFSIHDPGERQMFTGERYTIGLSGDIQNEHYHRYLFALRFCEGRDVLDVASGEGYGAALLAEVAHSVVGVDIDEPSVAFAARAYTRENLSFRKGSALAIPLDDATVDTVVSFETIEHFSDHVVFLQEVKRVLRPNGIFVVSTPDRSVYSEETGYRNPFHLHELKREEFSALLGTEFSEVKMFEQQVIAGSVISAAKDRVGSTESFATTDGWNFMHKPCLPHAPYLVAVASAEEVLMPAVSILHGLLTDAVVKEVTELRIEANQLRGELTNLNLEAEKTKRLLLEKDYDRGFLHAMLTNARHLTDRARADLVHARGTVEAARAVAEAEIDAFRRSTSWRVTKPLRSLRILVRRIMR